MFSAFEKGQKHLFCPNVVSGDNIQTTFINLLRVANMSSFFVNKMRFVPVLSECCLQGRHLDNIHNICLCYFLQKHVFKKFKIGICLCIFKKVNLKSAASLNYVCFFFQTSYFFALVCPNVVCETTFTQKITNVFWVAPNWSQRILKENIFWGRNALSNTIYTTLDADATWTCFRIVFKSSLCFVQLSPEATSALTFCWALLAFCPKEVTIAF